MQADKPHGSAHEPLQSFVEATTSNEVTDFVDEPSAAEWKCITCSNASLKAAHQQFQIMLLCL